MKRYVRLLPVLSLALLTAFSSCKKQSQSEDSSAEIQTHSDDYSTISASLDDVANDADVALETSASFSGRVENVNSICGAATVVDSTSNPRKITITYDGSNCAGT